MIHNDLINQPLSTVFLANCSYVVLLYHCPCKWRVEGSPACFAPPILYVSVHKQEPLIQWLSFFAVCYIFVFLHLDCFTIFLVMCL